MLVMPTNLAAAIHDIGYSPAVWGSSVGMS